METRNHTVAKAWSSLAPLGADGRPGLLVLVQIVTDVDLLAPIVAAARADGRFIVRVVVTGNALRKTPELGPLLGRALGEVPFEIADEEELLAGRAPDLTGIHAVLAATESTAPAHRFAHRLAMRANAARLHTATMQHGLENLGLTWFDAEYPPAAVRFASHTIFTWGGPERLHRDVLPETRARCVAVGCAKPARPSLDLPLRPGGRDRLIAVFENLHWQRYPDSYRTRFLADLEATAATHRDTTFLVKPHPAGKWLTRRFDGKHPAGDNLVIMVPGEAQWERYDAATVLALADAVVTTPSTIALDAARRTLPVAVAAYGLELTAYSPLRSLDGTAQWSQFVAATRDPARLAEERQRAERFTAAAVIEGDAARAIVEQLYARVAAGPSSPCPPDRILFSAVRRAPRAALARFFDRLRGGAAPAPAPAYVAEPGDYVLSLDAERVIAEALQREAGAGRRWPKAIAWDDAVIAVHWRKQRVRQFGVRRAARDTELLAQMDLRLAGAVREDLAADEPTTTLRRLLEAEPDAVLWVDGVWRCLGLAAEHRGLLPVATPPPPTAASIAVIVNYRDNAATTIACVESVARQRTTARLELLLVDNQSTAETQTQVVAAAQRLAAQRPGLTIRFLQHDEPYNHSRQNNRATTQATSEVLVFLNNDALLLSGDLLQRIADEALRPGVATAGPRIVGHGGQLVCAGMTASLLPAPGAERVTFQVRELEGPHAATARRGTLGNSFCCAAIAATTWAASGGLDEAAFPTQYNDADFCLRLAARGLRHIYLGEVVAFHQPGGSEARVRHEIERLHAAVLARHAEHLRSFDRRSPDHYSLPAGVAFDGAQGARWQALLQAQARLVAAGSNTVLAGEAHRQVTGVPLQVTSEAEELAAQWRGIDAIARAWLARPDRAFGDKLTPALRALLQRAADHAPQDAALLVCIVGGHDLALPARVLEFSLQQHSSAPLRFVFAAAGASAPAGALSLDAAALAIGDVADLANAGADRRTVLLTLKSLQPWRQPQHRDSEAWLDAFAEAVNAGVVTPKLVRAAVARGHADRALLRLPPPSSTADEVDRPDLRIHRLQRELANLRLSTTFRLGRMLLRPVLALHTLRRGRDA